MADNVESPTWPATHRRIVTGLLLFHMAAVLSAPWSTPEPSSDLSKSVVKVFEPYLRAAYLYHGYRYFNAFGSAPPGSPVAQSEAIYSTPTLRFDLTYPDGSERSVRFTDRDRDRPRLLYHRRLMISETLYGTLPQFSDVQFEQMVEQWQMSEQELRDQDHQRLADQMAREIQENRRQFYVARRLRNLLVAGFANYELRQAEAETLKLNLQAQRLPSPEEVETGARIGVDELYQQTQLGVFSRSPAPTPADVPAFDLRR